MRAWQRQERSILKLISSITQRLKNAGEALLLLRRCFTPLEDFTRCDDIIDVLDIPENLRCYSTDYSLDVCDWTRTSTREEKVEAESIYDIVASTKKTKEALKLMAMQMPRLMRAAQIAEIEMTTLSYQPSERQIEVFYEIFSYISDTAKELIDLFINAVL